MLGRLDELRARSRELSKESLLLRKQSAAILGDVQRALKRAAEANQEIRSRLEEMRIEMEDRVERCRLTDASGGTDA